MRNELAASVIGILITIILQSNNAVVCILISMVAGNLITLHQANFITLGSQIGITFVNAFYSLSLRKRAHFEIYYAVGIMNDVTSFLCYVIILPAEIYASPIESFAKYILEKWRNTCPKLQTLTVITRPFIDAIIQIDESVILPINDSHVFHEPTKFVIHRCIDPKTSEYIFCPYSHIFRYSRMSDKTIAAIIGFTTLITVILSQILMQIILHSLCDGLFSEKFMIFINKIACIKIIWFLDWIIDIFMIFIGFILFPIIEPHSLFSPTLNPYAKLDPQQSHRLYPMLLGANLGQSLGGVAAAFAVPSAALYK
uniref:Uncharacterized protein n=1 Tax=Panagrolaimus superbus TaxID=310955 RepID=A0A914Z1E5_9BILA